jgi:hypothetical protein
MSAEPHEHGFIPGIHNYCDRWCERCAFSSRCRSYAMEMAIAVDGFEGELAAAAEDLDSAPGEGGPGFDFAAEEMDDAVSEGDIEREMLRHDAAWLVADTHPLMETVKTLTKLAEPLIEGASLRAESGGAEAEAIREPLEVLCRYRYLVQAKVHRALLGREDEDLEDEGQPIPSDADGSAKIAHITCAAARDAARRLGDLDPALAPAAAVYVQTAERVLGLIDQAFPGHRSFRRPGFDDIGAA